MKSIFFRAWQLLLGWGFVGVVYNAADYIQAAGKVITPSWIDDMIPFSPSGIWAYLSFFLMIPLGYFMAPAARVRWLARAMQLAALGAGIVYLLWPTTLLSPADTGHGLASRLLKGLVTVDSAQNCFPSLHVALTMLVVWAIAVSRRRGVAWGFFLWGIAIAFSILQLKRHLFIDLIGGMILAWAAGMLATRMTGKQKELCRE